MRFLAWITSLSALVTLTGCASLAIRPCDTIADRDGKYFGRFFLGVATLGLSEVTIQQEEVRQAVRALTAARLRRGCRSYSTHTQSAGGQSVAVGTLVNGAPWTIVVYLNQDPDAPGAPPLTFLAPNASFRLAFRPGQHLLVARPSGVRPGLIARGDLEPTARDRSARPGIQAPFKEADFR